ncbi:hypothetical protein [Nonomuraea roseola]|uniref:DUF4158 domain-containing protein n=1 Tax=Nonomuraea roseola TaxID=46179 RepID=A0ABV5QFD2_9ACTN
MDGPPVDVDELVEHWTALDEERDATQLGFAVVLKFYTQHGRFPRGRGVAPDDAEKLTAWLLPRSHAERDPAQVRGGDAAPHA